MEQVRLNKLNQLLNQRCLAKLQLKEGQSILDVGAGTGLFAAEMAKVVGQSGRVVGLERDLNQFRSAELLMKDPALGNLTFIRQDICAVSKADFSGQQFDVVFSRFLLEHLPNPMIAIQNMKSFLKPGGKLILTDDDHETFKLYPEPPGFSVIWNAYIRSFDRLGNDPFIGRRLVQLVHNAGLENIENSLIFFGGNQHQPTFNFVVENLIGIINSAKDLIIKEQLLGQETFNQCIQHIKDWGQRPDAALWYGICWVEGWK